MEKLVKTFEDGEVTKYNFANGKSITLIVMKKNYNTYYGAIGWDFGEYKFNLYGQPLASHEYKSSNMAKLTETLDLYFNILRHKNKSQDKKLFIQGLKQVIHDIKQEIEFNNIKKLIV